MIILEDDYIYQEEYDRNFAEGIFINRSVIIDGQGHTIYFDKPEYVFHVNAYDVTLKNMVVYNTYMFDIVDLSNGSCITSNLTVIPVYTFLSLTVIANDIYDVYNPRDVINIEFETSIANAYFWVEIPGLLEKTNLTSNNERKGTLSISNITKSGCYLILCDFIEEKYIEGYYISPTIEIVGVPSAPKGYKKTIRILYRENPKVNNSFSDLQLLIDNSITNEINLEKDYEFFSGDKPININKSIVINGNNHSIDAKNVSKIFNIYADNVTLKNIIFTGASDNIYNKYTFFEPVVLDGMIRWYNAVGYGSPDCFYDTYCFSYGHSGGAIYCSGNNLTIINSSFINNYGSTGGGLYIVGNNAQLINLSFINNSAESGGAIFNSGKNTFILNSRFGLNNGGVGADSICSRNDINIQNCEFINDKSHVIFCGGSWQIDNMTSIYYHSFIEMPVEFSFNLTHLVNDEYNLKIKLISMGHWEGSLENKKFCLNIDGKVYNLQTDSNLQASLYLKLSNGVHDIEVYNPITKLSHSKVFNVSDSNEGNTSDTNLTTGNDASSDSDIKNSTSSNTETNTNTTKTNQNMENSTNVTEFNQDIGNNTNATEPSRDVANNTNVAEPNQDMRNNTNINQNTSSTSHRTINTKFSPNVIAKNKKFNKKTRVKKYSLTLKNKSKPIKNVWITLKIKGKTFKAKTNNKGQATFKITTLNKRGEFTAKIIFKGNKYYSSANKNVKIVVK